MLKKAWGWVKQYWASLTAVEEGGESVLYEAEQAPVSKWSEEAELLQEIERAHRYVAKMEYEKQLAESRHAEEVRIWRENNRMLDALYSKLNKQERRSQLHLVA